MKKFIAVALVVLMLMPMMMASAADASAVAPVAAQDDLQDLWSTVTGFSDLWGGLLKLVFGPDFWKQFLAALKDLAMGGLSIGDFLSSLGDMWNGISFGG